MGTATTVMTTITGGTTTGIISTTTGTIIGITTCTITGMAGNLIPGNFNLFLNCSDLQKNRDVSSNQLMIC